MALISMSYGAPPAFNLRAVQAGDAAEMESRLANEAAAAVAAGDDQLEDFQIAGAGSGARWESWMVTGSTAAEPVSIDLQEIFFAAAVAGNPTEAKFLLLKRLNEVTPAPQDIFKVVVAGAADGRSYMGVAVYFAEPEA